MPVNLAPSPDFSANQLPQLPPLELASEQQHAAQLPDYAGVAAVEAAQPGTRTALGAEAAAPDFAESMARLEAAANGEEVSPTDTRMYDVNAAHEAAIQENKLFDSRVGDVEAAHEMALQENKARDEAAAAAEAASLEAKTKEQADKTAADAEAQAAVQGDVRKEAEAALQQAGDGGLSSESNVSKNALTNEITVTTGNTIKILQPQVAGGYKSVSYAVNPITKTVTVTNHGASTVLTAPSTLEASSAGNPEGDVVMLPPAVARAAGFRAAVKQGNAQPQVAEAAAA
jgi:hypothetical protein